jgi:CubicO group peptidase (beta-lactamase class C family)
MIRLFLTELAEAPGAFTGRALRMRNTMKGMTFCRLAGTDRGLRTGMLILLLLIGLVLMECVGTTAVAALPMPGSTGADVSAIDAYVEAEMQATRLPGVALAIVHGDQIVHLRGFGVADDSGRPVTPQTPFTIGSTTKSFTALAIMQLVEAGTLDLDAPVQRYLPWFAVAEPGAGAQITLRQLLNQTSGFPTVEAPGELRRSDASSGALEQYVRALGTVRLATPPGTAFHYSNTNFDILGLVVQTVSGQAYERYLAQHIFAPLAMAHAFTSPADARAAGRATGHRYWFGQPIAYEMPYNRAELPAGFINASAEDLAHYLIAQLNDGRYDDRSVLSAAGIQQLHQPAVAIGYGGTSYAMGWFVGEIQGIPTVSHGGSTATFHANLVLLPRDRWGIVLLMNGENGLDGARIAAIGDGIISLLAGKQPPALGSAGNPRSLLLTYVLFVLLLQALGMIRSMILLRRWRREPQRRPHGRLRVRLRVLPSFVLSMLWPPLAFTVVPFFTGNDLLDMSVFAPDLGYALLISMGLALAWGLLRPLLVFRILRSPTIPAASIHRPYEVYP